MKIVTKQVHFGRTRSGRKLLRPGTAPVPFTGQVPRVARLLALAIHLDQLIRDGTVADQADLARLGHVSRTRLTQIMNLLHLAPDIQETILHLPPVTRGANAISERKLRPLTTVADWASQRRLFAKVVEGKKV